MEIGIVRQRYTPYGGAERFIADALAALSGEGVALTLYTRRWPGRDGVFRPVVCDPFYVGNVWRDWSFARAVRASWAAHRPDLVQSHERIAGCDVFRAGDGVHRVWLEERRRAMPAWRRVALAANPYHAYTLRAEARMFAHPALRAVVCNSRMVLDQVSSHYGVAREKLHLVYNAVDSERFSPALRAERGAVRARLGIAADAPLFLIVGSGYERKGVAQAIAALARLDATAALVVVGREKRRAQYEALAAHHGVVSRVTFAGAVDDVRPFYGAADAFVLPTLYDPLPNACLEAMAAGLPIVTSRQCGAAELVTPNDAGSVVDALDVEGLAAALRRLLDAPSRDAAGRNARAAVLPLTPAAMAGKLVALYRALLSSR
jgi:UDP-glucose:(heptosyl)LPS alpha-1,3-glucosyltransferase